MRYVSIAHNERSPGGPSVAKVLLPLGREDRLDVAGLRRLVGSINRYLGEDAGSDADAQVGAEAGGGLTITDSRPAGGAWLLDGLWQQLGIGTALREVLGGRRFGTDMERVTFALVARVSRQHEQVYVTVHGKPSAVLVATEDLESLEETIEILADAETMRRLHASDASRG